jgi:hypothetical protein
MLRLKSGKNGSVEVVFQYELKLQKAVELVRVQPMGMTNPARESITSVKSWVTRMGNLTNHGPEPGLCSQSRQITFRVSHSP